jgi:hypothetical protein
VTLAVLSCVTTLPLLQFFCTEKQLCKALTTPSQHPHVNHNAHHGLDGHPVTVSLVSALVDALLIQIALREEHAPAMTAPHGLSLIPALDPMMCAPVSAPTEDSPTAPRESPVPVLSATTGWTP